MSNDYETDEIAPLSELSPVLSQLPPMQRGLRLQTEMAKRCRRDNPKCDAYKEANKRLAVAALEADRTNEILNLMVDQIAEEFAIATFDVGGTQRTAFIPKAALDLEGKQK